MTTGTSCRVSATPAIECLARSSGPLSAQRQIRSAKAARSSRRLAVLLAGPERSLAPCLLAASALLTESHLLSECGTRLGVRGGYHRIIGWETPLLAIFLG